MNRCPLGTLALPWFVLGMVGEGRQEARISRGLSPLGGSMGKEA